MPSRTYRTSVIDVRQFAIVDSSAPTTNFYYANGLPIVSPVIALQVETGVERRLFAKFAPFSYLEDSTSEEGIVFIGDQVDNALHAKDSAGYSIKAYVEMKCISEDFDIESLTWNNQSVTFGSTEGTTYSGTTWRNAFIGVSGVPGSIELGSDSAGATWAMSFALRQPHPETRETLYGYRLRLWFEVDGVSDAVPDDKGRIILGNADSYTDGHVQKKSFIHHRKWTYIP